MGELGIGFDPGLGDPGTRWEQGGGEDMRESNRSTPPPTTPHQHEVCKGLKTSLLLLQYSL